MGIFSRFTSEKGKGTKRRGGRGRRKTPSAWRRWGRRLGLAGIVLSLCAGVFWFFISETDTYVYDILRSESVAHTAQMGFRVENFLVEGREYSDGAEILSLINVKKGDPLFAFDPDATKILLEQVSWVEKAHVERRLPDTIYVRLTERKPVALWKQGGQIFVVDRSGVVLTDTGLERFSNLVMIAGEDANRHVEDLAAMMHAEPAIAQRLDVAQWVESRRWNLHMKDGKLIILPEQNKELALGRLARKHDEEGILDKALTSIDARDPSRFIVQTERGKAQDYKSDAGLSRTGL